VSEPASIAAREELLEAFEAAEARDRLANTKVGCILVITLMPAGFLLDYFVYPEHLVDFLQLRLVCSAIGCVIFGVLFTRWGEAFSRHLGIIVPLLPVVFVSWMIYQTEGFNSPYYAGLNLVLLAVGAVLRWTFAESIAAVIIVLVIYALAGAGSSIHAEQRIVVNNLYFILLMDVIVVVGTYFQSKQRFREFSLRHELDANRRVLEENNRKLRELDELKSRFFANISHELRTPLTLVLAPLESLNQQFDRLSPQEVRELIETMQSNGLRLLKLINDLLDLVRLESGRMEVRREAVDLDEFIRGLQSAVRKVAEDRKLTLVLHVQESLGPVQVDRDKLEKIMLNLLFNAIKFTAAGGRVECRAEREGEALVLRVVDTGMGISEEQMPRIFDRFWQADTSAKRKYQGVGIGLALVKELAEAQGGSVNVQSQLGKGTTMIVRLPFLKADGPATSMPLAQGVPGTALDRLPIPMEDEEWLTSLYRRAELFPSLTSLHETIRPFEFNRSSGKPRVLVADDEPAMLRYLKMQLSPHFDVIEAVDGLQAAEKAAQFMPEIILCDMMMPEKDGLQVCRELRARTSTQHIPFVLLTARADEETKMAALKAGANDFLTKPFSTTELHIRLKNLVESYEQQRTLARQKQILESTIEQLKETESQLVQSEKLASLGRMSAGIIHEINNPLNYAKTGLFTLRRKSINLPAEQQANFTEILTDVEEGIDRVKNIVSDLRTFTHPSAGQFQEVSVDKVITSALRFLSNELRDNVQLDKQIEEDLAVVCNQNQIIQVLVNLFQNALDAMKGKKYDQGGPVLVIEAKHVGKGCRLIIRDNGPGIDAEHLDKIFDPFFTTKDVGEGMGLGLSICYRIIQEHGGTITARSEPGGGCEFTLEFPEKL
jgi:signal transduction histidine kinase